MSAAEPGSPARRLAPILGGVVLVALTGLAAAAVQPILEAGWFGLERPGHEGARWVSLALSAGALWLMVALVCRRLGEPVAGAGDWLRRYTTFLALFYWIVGLHFLLLVEGGWSPDLADALLLPSAELLLLATLCAVLWPLAFDVAPWRSTARRLFVWNVLLLAGYLLIRQPELAERLLVRAGLLRPPMDWVHGERFAREAPYLAPLAPLAWSVWRSWRDSVAGRHSKGKVLG